MGRSVKKKRRSARRSNESSWLNCPAIIKGPYISGKDEDGSDIPLPEKFSSYEPWKFVLSEAESKKVSYPQKIEELETRLASVEKDLSSRNSKYQQLKKNFIIMVSDNNNDANRAREAAVKKVRVENDIPL
ncbi:hypothetical protein C5167_039864 [Papaver somniferum]|uniref:Uncharacterized protein n=1 Tax=Papaver somniferum TaxID=3469 RepID=A0A4Y7IDD6_PAPSO|nr:hypothetical protein C5167_039864 [Papaver somniferum]